MYYRGGCRIRRPCNEVYSRAHRRPGDSGGACLCSGLWVSLLRFVGGEPIDVEALKRRFVLTPNSEVYVRRLLRLLSGSRCALLLEGPTSCGKTSMVSFLAAATGHKCIRINNHENTDIQDYVGSYAPDAEGRLVFAEGPLTLAVRHGWWVLIDELNLAPSDVLEGKQRISAAAGAGCWPASTALSGTRLLLTARCCSSLISRSLRRNAWREGNGRGRRIGCWEGGALAVFAASMPLLLLLWSVQRSIVCWTATAS